MNSHRITIKPNNNLTNLTTKQHNIKPTNKNTQKKIILTNENENEETFFSYLPQLFLDLVITQQVTIYCQYTRHHKKPTDSTV